MTRVNSTNTIITSPEEFKKATDEIARLQLLVGHEKAELKLGVDELTETHMAKISEAESIVKQQLALCEVYARQNRRDLFHGRAKSAESDTAIYGFNKPKQSIHLNNGETEASVIQKAQKHGLIQVIKTTLKIIKTELAKLSEEDQAKVGIHTRSTERFYVKAKAENFQD